MLDVWGISGFVVVNVCPMREREIVRKLAALVAAVAMLYASPASAQYAPTFTAAVSDTTVVVGETVVVNGTCDAGGPVAVTLDGSGALGSAKTAADGAYSIRVTIPKVASGEHTLKTTCGDQSQATTIRVGGTSVRTNPGTGTIDSGSLVRTGTSSSGSLLRWGGVLVLGGAALLLAGRRLRSA